MKQIIAQLLQHLSNLKQHLLQQIQMIKLLRSSKGLEMRDDTALELVKELSLIREQLTKVRGHMESFPVAEQFMVNMETQRADARANAQEVQTPQLPSLRVLKHGETPPWVLEAEKWMWKNEVDDQEELEAFLKINPDGKSGGLPWCAYFLNAVFDACGIEGTKTSNGARDGKSTSFVDWGQITEKRDGAVGIFYDQAGGSGHVAIVCENGTKLLGGNQGDTVRLNKIDWYEKNQKYADYRWPSEYEIPS